MPRKQTTPLPADVPDAPAPAAAPDDVLEQSAYLDSEPAFEAWWRLQCLQNDNQWARLIGSDLVSRLAPIGITTLRQLATAADPTLRVPVPDAGLRVLLRSAAAQTVSESEPPV